MVAVKGRNVTTGRQGRFWSDEVTVPNVLGPWAGPLSVYANKSVGGSSVMRIDSRSAAIPAVAQSITYDLDGNTLSDGLWDYQWDAENRLVRLETTVAARSGGIAHRIINFTYDYLGRRVQKQMIDGVTVTELSSARYIYNGWDIIAEYSVLNGSTLDKLQRTYAWGVDIAGSLADAGGVGALLQFVNSTTGTSYLPSYDGNGNVASLINLGTGALAAAYEYSPYGEMLRDEIHDNAVAPFAFKFSSKWRDAETGWMNYGRRYFDPRNGRFIGRDPIAEEGGINLYAFCGNNPVDRWDRSGMDPPIDPNTAGYILAGGSGTSPGSFVGHFFTATVGPDGKIHMLDYGANDLSGGSLNVPAAVIPTIDVHVDESIFETTEEFSDWTSRHGYSVFATYVSEDQLAAANHAMQLIMANPPPYAGDQLGGESCITVGSQVLAAAGIQTPLETAYNAWAASV
ncbi:MAG TPA: RHS repeat-associated core domain-containing protein, partial [Opitutaceae bacterium]|nr:RHS repeat-associated core domain-containing protein [Opitutaceae bacterium]